MKQTLFNKIMNKYHKFEFITAITFIFIILGICVITLFFYERYMVSVKTYTSDVLEFSEIILHNSHITGFLIQLHESGLKINQDMEAVNYAFSLIEVS